MRFKEPLTKATLQEIQDRATGPDARVVLWEVARLRSVLLYADQLQRMLTTLPGPQGEIVETLREKLRDEPCVKEFPWLPPRAYLGELRRKHCPTQECFRTDGAFLSLDCHFVERRIRRGHFRIAPEPTFYFIKHHTSA